MMPDLDRYAATVLGAYGVSIALLALLVLLSLWRAARVRRELDTVERQIGRGRP